MEDRVFQPQQVKSCRRVVGVCLGSLVVTRALDYETVKEYIITVEARDGGTPSLSSTCVVKVLVVDANDNRPMFTQPSYTAVVREDVALNTSLLQVSCS